MKFTLEHKQEIDGRRIVEVPEFPGVLNNVSRFPLRGYSVIAISILLFLPLHTVIATPRVFDLLRNFTKGIGLRFVESANDYTHIWMPGEDYGHYFNGSLTVHVDDIIVDSATHQRRFYLTMRSVGTNNDWDVGGNHSYLLDNTWRDSIVEWMDSSYRLGTHKITGWIFPDMFDRGTDSTVAEWRGYPYQNYYRYLADDTLDTLDVRHDTLTLATRWAALYSKSKFLTITESQGLARYHEEGDSSVAGVFTSTYTSTLTIDTTATRVLTPPNIRITPVELGIHPNPSTRSFMLRPSGFEPGELLITIVDVLGRERLRFRTTVGDNGIADQHIDCSSFPDGMYACRAASRGNVATRWLMVAK